MAMVVKNNMSAVSTLNTLNKNSSALQKSLSKVSSGMKINSAQDDASGYAISERMRVQIRSLDQANQNTQNGSSLMKTAEGAVSSTVEILKSLKEKAINAANDTNKDSDRTTIQKEIDQFIDQIDDNALVTFNGKYLVDGSKAQEGNATYTAMTNQSLAEDTDGSTRLTNLKNRNNESLEIETTDYVTASFVKNGVTYTTKFGVDAKTDLNDIFKNLNSVSDPTGKKVNAFGAAQTTTEKMSLTDAKAVLDAIGSDAGSATTRLFDLASKGTTATDVKVASGAYSGETVTKAMFDAAVNTYTSAVEDGGKGMEIGEVLRLMGSKTGEEVNEAYQTLRSEIINGASSPTVAGANTFTATNVSDSKATLESNSKVSYTFQAQVYDAEGNLSKQDVVEHTAVVSGSSTFSANATGTITASSTSLTTTEKEQYADAVMKSVENVANLLANGSAPNTDVTIASAIKNASDTFVAGAERVEIANAAAGSANTDNIKFTNTTTNTAVFQASDISTAESTKAYALAYAFDAAYNGDLVNGKTNAVGLMASGDLETTADKTNGVTITSREKGVAGQISGVTISISDSQGNVKKSANASLDAFSTTVYAKNKSDANELSFQVGASANQAIAVGLEDMRSEALGLKGSDGSKVSVATQDKANAAVAVFDNAIQKALDQQTTIGSIEARLEYTSQNLTTSSENVQAAESTIRDADMAKEMTNYTKNNVLLQAAQSMLAQANQSSSAVLSLLQ